MMDEDCGDDGLEHTRVGEKCKNCGRKATKTVVFCVVICMTKGGRNVQLRTQTKTNIEDGQPKNKFLLLKFNLLA